jgi:tetratricopeptide (TPR) repeat protein
VRGLAALALDREDLDAAYDLHRRLIELGEHAPEVFYNAGLICQKKGNSEDAALFYRQALIERPQLAEAMLNLGHALMALGEEEEARSCWRRAVREMPELARTYFEPEVEKAN